jgi:hypothetical protein
VLSANNTAPNHQCSIVDTDPDPACHLDADPDPAFHFDKDPTFNLMHIQVPDPDPQHCTNEAVNPIIEMQTMKFRKLNLHFSRIIASGINREEKASTQVRGFFYICTTKTMVRDDSVHQQWCGIIKEKCHVCTLLISEEKS